MTEKNQQVGLIVRGVLALGRRLRAERPDGSASLAAISLLRTLKRTGSVPVSRLAAEERLAPQSLTRLIAELEQAGWIQRERNEADRREILISLTPKGGDVLANDMHARTAWLEEALAAALDDGERDALGKAAHAMLKLAAHDATSPAPDAGEERGGS